MRELVEVLAGRGEDVDLDRAALQLATIEYPGLDVAPFLAILDSYAAELAGRLGDRTDGPRFVAAANQYLFAELNFAGNAKNYYDPRNSCLNEVLTARVGIPITLSVVYMEIARRLARPVRGIGFPGHFLVQYDDGVYSTFIDPFHGGNLLRAEECFELASRASGTPVARDPTFLQPVGKSQILHRMMNNLRAVYLSRQAYGKALRAVDLLLEAHPDSADDYQQRGIVHLQMRNFRAARSDFQRYLALDPDAPDREPVEKQLRALNQYIAQMN